MQCARHVACRQRGFREPRKRVYLGILVTNSNHALALACRGLRREACLLLRAFCFFTDGSKACSTTSSMCSTRMKFRSSQDLLGNLDHVLLVLLRHDHGLQPGAMRGHHFFFQPADRQYAAPQRDLARHAHFAPHRPLRERGDQRRRHGDARRRAIFGNAAFRHVDVNVGLFEVGEIDLEVLWRAIGCRTAPPGSIPASPRPAGRSASSCLCRPAASLRSAGCRRPLRCTPRRWRCRLRPSLPPGQTSTRRAEIFVEGVRRDLARVPLAFRHFARGLARQVGQLPIEIAHARFKGVLADDAAHAPLRRCAADRA